MNNKIISIKINRVFKTEKTIQNGLMFVKNLPQNLGALFRMPDKKIHKFWMKNTYVSLDVIFLDQNFKIVGFIENTIPLNLSLVYVNHPSKYVIEIKSGFIKKNNIKVGNIVKPIYIKKTQNKIKTKKNNTKKLKTK
jgi:uncharacterized membrane protein (UPF0127 family)